MSFILYHYHFYWGFPMILSFFTLRARSRLARSRAGSHATSSHTFGQFRKQQASLHSFLRRKRLRETGGREPEREGEGGGQRECTGG